MLPSPPTTGNSGNSTGASQDANNKLGKKPRKSRSRGLRTTTGCRTCRLRHMKCDEAKPKCGACRRSARECDYQPGEQQEKRPVKTAPSRPPASRPDPIREEIAASNGRQSLDITNALVSPATTTQRVSISDRSSQNLAFRNSPEPPWDQANPLDVFQTVTSPQSTLSSAAGWSLDVAPLRWFDLLAGDASANDEEFSMGLVNWRDNTNQDTVGTLHQQQQQQPLAGTPGTHSFGTSTHLGGPLLPPPTPSAMELPNLVKEPWQVAYQLQPHEAPIFRRFVDRISLWMDLYDPMKHFSSFVPHLAMANEGLMQAILALGARHLSIKPENGSTVDRNVAVEYYYKTLHYLQGAMKFESYNRSLELIATALTVSMYEMIDGYGKGWERHLKGVFWIQRSRNIGAESFGLEGAGWWAWLRQDVWAAFREKRRVYSFHRPTTPYENMTQYDLASRAVYLLAQCVNYSSEQDARDGVSNLHARIDRAKVLHTLLDEWHNSLTVHFAQLPWSGPRTSEHVFEPVWINPAPLAVAMQYHYFANILLLVHEPSAGGYDDFLRREKQLGDAVDTICGIAMTISDEPSIISSTQCLFAAGLFTHDRDPRKRDAIVKLIDDHQIRTGWPVSSLTEELQAEWTTADAKR